MSLDKLEVIKSICVRNYSDLDYNYQLMTLINFITSSLN